ncbi:hypothetical protein [Catellatospora tritici]|uniref:hypothetical protein n=1 Tax=Catellatospora tritici TaxID=2851566 RepID=UPI001C2CCF4E|nr:hypothetical protein [Catellatospora tritici]MBV1854927.1 hypothetical protein [Catellatospora tritici]
MRDNPYRAPDDPSTSAVAVLPDAPPAPPINPFQARARRMWRGAGLAALGHLATILAAVVAALAFGRPAPGDYDTDLESMYAAGGLLSQGLLAVAALTYGIVRIVRRDSGLGVGVLVGWGVGLMVTPIPAFVVLIALTR